MFECTVGSRCCNSLSKKMILLSTEDFSRLLSQNSWMSFHSTSCQRTVAAPQIPPALVENSVHCGNFYSLVDDLSWLKSFSHIDFWLLFPHLHRVSPCLCGLDRYELRSVTAILGEWGTLVLPVCRALSPEFSISRQCPEAIISCVVTVPKNSSQESGLIARGVVQAQLESLAVEDLWTLVAVILIVIIYRLTLAEPVAI